MAFDPSSSVLAEDNHQKISYDYRPAGPTLNAFHSDNENFFRCLFGPLGSGKTTTCCAEIMNRSTRQLPNRLGLRRTRWLIVRNTLPELMTTTIPSWRESFGAAWGKTNNSPPITHAVRFRMPDGTRVEADVIFLGLDGPDAPDKIRGLEITGAWINEAKDVQKAVLDMLTGRVGRFPPRRKTQGEPGPTWFGVFADTNMPDEGHWLYTAAEKETPRGWAFYRQPGGVKKVEKQWVLNAAAENLVNLPPNYYLNQLAGKGDDWIRVYLGAEYGYVREGKSVYHEYDDVAHVADLEPNPDIPIHIGCDFGLTPAAVFFQQDPLGRVLVHDEICIAEGSATTLAVSINRLLAQKYPGYKIGTVTGDPGGNIKSQNDEKTAMMIMRAEGVPIRPADTNSFGLRREAVARCLNRLIEGRPGMLINRHCLTLRAGMSGRYFFKKSGTTPEHLTGGSDRVVYAETPVKTFESHICEALQYGCLGIGEGHEAMRRRSADTRNDTPTTVRFGGRRGQKTRSALIKIRRK